MDLTASPCYTTNTNKHLSEREGGRDGEREREKERDRQTETDR